jgi:hypothetical protein
MIRKAKFLALIYFVHCAVGYSQPASGLKLAWDASPSAVAGYYLYAVDTGNGQSVKSDIGNTLSASLNSITAGHKYSIYLTAYDSNKTETNPSNVISYTAPGVAGLPSDLSLSMNAIGQFWIRGNPNIIYGVQASADFKHWVEIGQVAGALNAVPFSDKALAQMRYYRAVVK